MGRMARNGLRNYRMSEIIKSAQPGFTCSKLTIETLEQGVKYAQS